MNHAVKIFSEKKGKTIELRMTQIISLILFIRAEDTRRILQTSTGLGKSLIIAFLAVLKAVEGLNVDVITSS